jgi:molybdopterin synthase sulfur carrier subunit
VIYRGAGLAIKRLAQVKLFGSLRQYVDKHQFETKAKSIYQLLTMLCADNAAFCEALFADDQLRPFIKITINGRDIQLMDGLETAVSNNDTIAIFPPIAGG